VKLAAVVVLSISRNLRSGASKSEQEQRSRARLAMLEMSAFVFKRSEKMP